MKLIGLLAGVSWEAAATYYRMMNDFTRKTLGEGHSARILLHSIDIGAARRDEDGNAGLDAALAEGALSLRSGGADFIVVAGSRTHQLADTIAAACGLDILHIADPVGAEMKKDGCRRVALLGAHLSDGNDVFSERLNRTYGISVMTPDAGQRSEIDRIVTEELSQGILHSESRSFAAETIASLRDRGAEAVILGCPLITTIVPPDSDVIPAYDATRLHARAAVRQAVGRCQV